MELKHPYIVQIKGVAVACIDVSAVTALIAAMDNADAQKTSAKPVIAADSGTAVRHQSRPRQQSRRKRQSAAITKRIATHVLEEINSAGESGLPSERLGEILQLSDLKGLGGRIITLKKVLREHGIAADGLFHDLRNQHGKFWLPGPKISEALASLQGKGGAK